MTDQIFAYIVHKNGVADDSAVELGQAAASINPDAGLTAIVVGTGTSLATVCDEVAKWYPTVWKVDNAACEYPNAEIIRQGLVSVLPDNALILVPHDTFGMDLAPGLAVKMGSSFISDVVGIDKVDGSEMTLVRQEYGGQVSTHVAADVSAGGVINIRPGVFQVETPPSLTGEVVDKSGDFGEPTSNRTFTEIVEAEVGDVDITKSEVLVSVGRGIEDEDNLEIAFDLAKVMGADVSCSRPIVDAKWMEKSRQVGTSGQTVKPKVYLAMGISGSFQHLGGIKGNPFIVAVNKNVKAPIFQVADVGIEADILDFIPELTEAIEEL